VIAVFRFFLAAAETAVNMIVGFCKVNIDSRMEKLKRF